MMPNSQTAQPGPSRPVLAITMGDAAGVGPEIIVDALSRPEIYAVCRPLVVGDEIVMRHAVEVRKLPLQVHRVAKPDEGVYATGDARCAEPGQHPLGDADHRQGLRHGRQGRG